MQTYRKNNEIRAYQVRVTDEMGVQLGIMDFRIALENARAKNLDLVEIVPNAKPPVCKIADYSKLMYEQAKAEKKNKTKSKELKTVTIGYNTSDHDLKLKIEQAKGFLEDKHPVKFALEYRGRESMFVNTMLERMKDVSKQIKSNPFVEPKVENRSITLNFNP